MSFRNGIQVDPKVLTSYIVNGLNKYKTEDLFKTCITCVNFDSTTEFCKLVDKRPPAFIIVRACDQYRDTDEVPF